MSRSSAPPLRLALGSDRVLTALAALALAGIAIAVVVHTFLFSGPWLAILALFAAVLAAGWTYRLRMPQWDWLGCDAEGEWWLATRAGLREERRLPIRVGPDSRVGAWLVVLVWSAPDNGRCGVLWVPWWRMAPEDFRRLRARLRWPLDVPGKPGLGARLQAVGRQAVAILASVSRHGVRRMNSPRQMAAVEHLLSDDPDHVYTEDELDAIEAVDPELALRLDRAQTFAQREAADVPADGPIDETVVRQAVEEARRILMQDGGDIEYVGLEGRTVQVRLKGACVGCPRSTLDLKNVVERLVRSRAPGVERVANTF
ncbi:MAG: NifU family protein [Thioalkalivibrio sp.]|nr:MAG: NifU family protein [Thioalkalivibrio sp.]